MNPYREQVEPCAAAEEPPERDDELMLVGVWFFLGIVLVAADIGQSESWGISASLGMLMLFVAMHGLRQRRKWQKNKVGSQARTGD